MSKTEKEKKVESILKKKLYLLLVNTEKSNLRPYQISYLRFLITRHCLQISGGGCDEVVIGSPDVQEYNS